MHDCCAKAITCKLRLAACARCVLQEVCRDLVAFVCCAVTIMNVNADRIVELNLAIHTSKEMNKRSLQVLVLVATSPLPQPKSSKKKGYSRVHASLSQQRGCSQVLSSQCRGGLRGSFLTSRSPKKRNSRILTFPPHPKKRYSRVLISRSGDEIITVNNITVRTVILFTCCRCGSLKR